MQHNDKITRRKFLKRAGKLVYLTPVMYTFFTETKEAIAQGRAAALERRVDRLEAAAAAGNQQAAQQLQNLRERLVSPP